MENKKYVLYIGRWQPFHKGHKYIIDKALERNENVLVGIRETPLSEGDPYTEEERKQMIELTYKNEVHSKQLKVISIPDIEAISIGRKVGYEIRELTDQVPEDVKGISATKIRNLMDSNDDSWKNYVPSGTVEFFESQRKEQKGKVFWLTGLSGAGKSTIAQALKVKLEEKLGKNVKILDGDEVRTNLTSDLGFSKEDRDENIKRVTFVSKCVAETGGYAIVAAISPYREGRLKARKEIGADSFVEVFVNPGLEECEKRDVKGLYKKARSGEIKNFTGISDPYEEPTNEDGKTPFINLDTKNLTVNECVDIILGEKE